MKNVSEVEFVERFFREAPVIGLLSGLFFSRCATLTGFFKPPSFTFNLLSLYLLLRSIMNIQRKRTRLVLNQSNISPLPFTAKLEHRDGNRNTLTSYYKQLPTVLSK